MQGSGQYQIVTMEVDVLKRKRLAVAMKEKIVQGGGDG